MHDDTTLIYTQPKLNNVEDNVNNELRCTCISNWFKANKLLLNLKKTNFCVFHNNCRDMSTLENISLAIDSIPISKVNVVNFLGIQIDSDLKWDVHINNIKSKISKCIGILYKLRFHVPSSVLVTLYNSLVLPYLSYCIVVWGNSCQTRMDVLFKLQKRAIRICTNSNYRAHSAPLFRKLKTLNVHDLFLYHTAIIGFQYFQCVLPSSISSMFLTNSQIHDHYTRKSTLLHLWKVKTTYSKRSTRYNVPQVWNSLPNDFRSYTNLSLFKKKLKVKGIV